MMAELKELLLEREKAQKNSNVMEEVKILKKICKLSFEKYGENSYEYMHYLNELAGSLKYIGEYTESLENISRVKKITEKLYGKYSKEYATVLLNEAEIIRFSGKLDNIETIYLTVIDIYEKNLCQREYIYAGVCNNIGLYYQNINNFEKAIKYHEKSLDILKDMKEHKVEYATTLNNLFMPYKELKKLDKAKKYLDEALSIYEEKLGKNHAMYSSTLNNLAIYMLEIGDLELSLKYFEDSLLIVKNSFGIKSINYQNLKSNVDFIKELIEKNRKKIVDENSKLIDISRDFTEKYILKTIKEKDEDLLKDISIAMIGEGSEVLGFEDELSKDHDYTFMPTIFVSKENILRLKNILDELPKEYLGIKHIENDVIKERKGAIIFEDFLFRFIGKENINLTILDYLTIPEYALLNISNATFFYKGNDKIEKEIIKLKYYPNVIKEHKIATRCTLIAQSGQYNYLRLRKRNDIIGANTALSTFINEVIHLVFLLNEKYMPFYKWQSKMLKKLPILGEEIYKRIERILQNNHIYDMYKISNEIEEICYFLVEELKRQKLSNIKGYFMLNHGIYIQKNIDDDVLKHYSAYKD